MTPHESLYDHAGGAPAIHALEEAFYAKVLADPVLQPLFGSGQPQHVEHLTEVQRERFVEFCLQALDESELPRDAPFVEAVRSHVEFGTRVAMQNSNAESDEGLHPLREVPRWTWAGDDASASVSGAAPAAPPPTGRGSRPCPSG